MLYTVDSRILFLLFNLVTWHMATLVGFADRQLPPLPTSSSTHSLKSSLGTRSEASGCWSALLAASQDCPRGNTLRRGYSYKIYRSFNYAAGKYAHASQFESSARHKELLRPSVRSLSRANCKLKRGSASGREKKIKYLHDLNSERKLRVTRTLQLLCPFFSRSDAIRIAFL